MNYYPLSVFALSIYTISFYLLRYFELTNSDTITIMWLSRVCKVSCYATIVLLALAFIQRIIIPMWA